MPLSALVVHPLETLEQARKGAARLTAYAEPGACPRMRQRQLGAAQQQLVTVQMLLEITVMHPLAIGGITDDGMAQVFHVAPQLMLTPRSWPQLDQGVAGAGIAIDGQRQLQSGKAPIMGARRQGRSMALRAVWCMPATVIVMPSRQRVIDHPLGLRPAAHHRPVALIHLILGKLPPDLTGHFALETKQQHARSPAIEAMQGRNLASQLIAQQLHRKTRFMTIEVAAMHQQAGRFMDGHQGIILIKKGEHGRQMELGER